MSSPPLPFPWPCGLRVVLFALLVAAGVALLIGFTTRPELWVPLACLMLGASLVVLASSVAIVNWARDGATQRFLLASRAGTIETRSRLLAILYMASFGAIGLFITGVSLGLLLARLTGGLTPQAGP